MTDTETCSFESPLKVDKDWKEKFFYPANHVSEVEPKKVRKNNDAPIIEDWVSNDEDEDESPIVVKKKIAIPTAAKIQKPVRKPMRYAEMYRLQRPRGNQRNWNGQKSNQLGRELGDKIRVSAVDRVDQLRVRGRLAARIDEEQPCILLTERHVSRGYVRTRRHFSTINTNASRCERATRGLKDNGTAINTARPEINTGSREVSTASYFYVSLLILLVTFNTGQDIEHEKLRVETVDSNENRE
ncbi:hypothetical protein Tco_1283681 [Tanacetum coccineum]